MKRRFHAFWKHLARLIRPAVHDAEMEEEIRQHIGTLIERKISDGMAPAEAEREALREFGCVQQIKERAREQRLWTWPDELRQDLRFGVRMLFRQPGFSALALLCLTLGIGTNAAVFSWIEGILFHPYPLVMNEDRMFAIAGTTKGAAETESLSYPDFLDLQRGSTLAESFIVDRIVGTSLSVGDRSERASAGLVSANYFDALGIQPVMGRGFRPEEGEGRNAHPVTVISYQAWKDRYKSDPAIIGRTQYLNGVEHTIIGVAPENFVGTFVGYSFQFWVPVSMQETFDPTGYKMEDRSARWVEGYVFLKPGVTRQQAQEELNGIARRLEAQYPEVDRGRSVQLFPLWKTPFNAAGGMLPTLEIALAVVVFVLVIACANVSNLLLVRSLSRRQEMTMRLALGATRKRLMRQLLTEGLILSALAAGAGVLVAHWCRNALVLAYPSPAPGIIVNYPGQIDWRVLSLSAGVCIGATLLFALAPALQAGKVNLAGTLRGESSGIIGGHGRSRLRSVLVLIQLALSFVLLAGAGLLIQSVERMRIADPGFSVKDVILSGVDLVSAGYNEERARRFENQLLERIRLLPGVQFASVSRVRPFSYRNYSSAPLMFDDYQPKADENPTVDYNEVGEDYLATAGIPILSGREFARTDDEKAPRVAIVNELMAARYWPEKNAVGQRLKVKDQWLQVVGVARMANYRTKLETPKPFFYVPRRQNFTAQGAFLIRTALSPGAMATALAEEVRRLDPTLAPQDTIPIQEQLDRMTYTQRLAVALLGVFGGVALLLAAVGLYGVMSYAVSQSFHELGLRMALGAGARDVLRLVLTRGFVLIGAGIALGLALALGLTKFMGKLLYHISPRDPLTFCAALLVLATVAFLACLIPALRATRIDPARALRG